MLSWLDLYLYDFSILKSSNIRKPIKLIPIKLRRVYLLDSTLRLDYKL